MRVGAALDSGSASVFQPLIAAATRARRQIASQGKAAADETTRAVDKAAKDQAKAVERSAKQQAKAATDAAKQRARDEALIVKNTVRMIEQGYKRQEEARKALLSAGGRILGGVGGAAFGLAQRGIGKGASVAADLVRESLETQAIATRVSINARGAGKGFVDPSTLRREFEGTAMATPGIKADDIGLATQRYVDLTGDIDTARSSMQTFATVASATGAKVEDVATAAASLGSKFDVKSVGDMQKVMAGLAFQGKGGAMTLADLAAQFQRLAAAGAAFGLGKGPEAVAKLGGVLQIARQGTGNARQAATAVENIFASLTQKSGKSLYGKNGEKRDLNEVLAERVSKAGGNDMASKTAALMKFFGKQGYRGVTPLLAEYRRASEGKSGTEAQKAGYDAVLKMLNDMASTGGQWSELMKDAGMQQTTLSAQLTGAWETLKAATGERLAPALVGLASKLMSDGKALDLFIAAIDKAADGINGLATLLQRMGFLSGGSATEKAKAADAKSVVASQELKHLTAERAGIQEDVTLSPEDKWQALHKKDEEIAAKKVEAEALLDKANTRKQFAAELGEKVDGIKSGAISPERASELYADEGEMSGHRAGHQSNDLLDALLELTKAAGFGVDFKQSDAVQGALGESGAQQELRHASEEHARAAAALKESADAIKEGAAALKGAGGPGSGSTTGPTPLR